jgi:hypothetical protein
MNTILASIMKMFEDCAKRLPDKRNIDHLELFSRDFYFRALRSLVILSFPQLLSFSSVFPKPLSETLRRSSDRRIPV